MQGARDGGAAVGGLKVGDEGKARVARHAEDRLEERRQDDLSGTQSAVEGEHLNEAHGEHDTGEQIEGEEEARAGAEAAGALKVAGRAGDGAVLADEGRVVEGAEPLVGVGHLVEDAGEDDDGKRERDVRAEAHLRILLAGSLSLGIRHESCPFSEGGLK